MSATETVPTPTPTYEEKRAKQRTRRQEKEAARALDFVTGRIRSQLRRQIDQIMKPNINEFIEALAAGKGIRVHVEIVDQTPPVTVPPEESKIERPSLIVVP